MAVEELLPKQTQNFLLAYLERQNKHKRSSKEEKYGATRL
jgi:hypothetical protein